MPKATAVWLIENTTLTFQQIAEFSGMHSLEIQGIADGDMASGIVGLDPTLNGQLTWEEIHRCEAEPTASLHIIEISSKKTPRSQQKARYVPLSRRQDRPNAIAWVLKNHPEISDAQIMRLLGTTKTTINALRSRTHANIQNIKPRHPVALGICQQSDWDEAVTLAAARQESKASKE
jgi:hypothetical protein